MARRRAKVSRLSFPAVVSDPNDPEWESAVDELVKQHMKGAADRYYFESVIRSPQGGLPTMDLVKDFFHSLIGTAGETHRDQTAVELVPQIAVYVGKASGDDNLKKRAAKHASSGKGGKELNMFWAFLEFKDSDVPDVLKDLGFDAEDLAFLFEKRVQHMFAKWLAYVSDDGKSPSVGGGTRAKLVRGSHYVYCAFNIDFDEPSPSSSSSSSSSAGKKRHLPESDEESPNKRLDLTE